MIDRKKTEKCITDSKMSTHPATKTSGKGDRTRGKVMPLLILFGFKTYCEFIIFSVTRFRPGKNKASQIQLNRKSFKKHS